MSRPTEIKLYLDDINAADLREAMAEVKRNLRREEGQRDHVMQSWGMVLPMGEDGRIEDLVSDWDGSPRITDVRKAFKDPRVDRVSFDCQCYWIDNEIPMADRWDNLEPTGSYADVTVCRGSDPLPDELVDADMAISRMAPEILQEVVDSSELLAALTDGSDEDALTAARKALEVSQ